MQVAIYLAGEKNQVLDAIPWVRCASGNVSYGVWDVGLFEKEHCKPRVGESVLDKTYDFAAFSKL